MDETTKNKENKKITRPYTWTQIEHSKKRRQRHDEKDTKGKKREHMTLKKQKTPEPKQKKEIKQSQRSRPKQNTTKQNKTKQNKTKQNKT